MELTKEEVEKLLGYEIVKFKITKRAYRGKKVSKITLAVQPKKEPEHITVTLKLK
jgi:hypothetical protein